MRRLRTRQPRLRTVRRPRAGRNPLPPKRRLTTALKRLPPMRRLAAWLPRLRSVRWLAAGLGGLSVVRRPAGRLARLRPVRQLAAWVIRLPIVRWLAGQWRAVHRLWTEVRCLAPMRRLAARLTTVERLPARLRAVRALASRPIPALRHGRLTALQHPAWVLRGDASGLVASDLRRRRALTRAARTPRTAGVRQAAARWRCESARRWRLLG